MAFEPIGTTEIARLALAVGSAVAVAVTVTVPGDAGAVKTVAAPLEVWDRENVPQAAPPQDQLTPAAEGSLPTLAVRLTDWLIVMVPGALVRLTKTSAGV
jgi:hypothetical protein